MDDSQLESLLRGAGRDERPTPPDPCLADRVQRRLRRRRNGRRVVGVAAIAGALVFAALATLVRLPQRNAAPTDADVAHSQSPHHTDQPQRATTEEIRQIEDEIDRLNEEIQWSLQRAAIHQHAAASRPRKTVVLPPLTAQDAARIELEKSAFLLVERASWKTDSTDDNLVADIYRGVVRRFPDTNAAQTAIHQLNQITINNGDH